MFTLAPLRLPFSRFCIRYLNSCHFVCHFPSLRSLLFPHITFVIFAPLHSHFPALPFVIFPPLCSSFSCHFVCHFPAILFVIFPPLRSSVVTLPLFPPLHLSSRSSPSRLYVDHFFAWLPLRLSFSCHYVLHFSPKGLS